MDEQLSHSLSVATTPPELPMSCFYVLLLDAVFLVISILERFSGAVLRWSFELWRKVVVVLSTATGMTDTLHIFDARVLP